MIGDGGRLTMGDGGGLTIGEGGSETIGDGGGLIIGDGGGFTIGEGGGLTRGDGGGETIGDGGELMIGDGGLIIGEGGELMIDDGRDTMGDGGGETIGDGGDEMDDIALLPAPGDITGDVKNIDLKSPADDRLSISFCAFCMEFKSISFGSQSLGMIPRSSNSSLNCSYNALRSSSSSKSAANLSKVRKSCASLNL